MSQAKTLEVYLTVIESTINALFKEMKTKGFDTAEIESLHVLKEKWTERLCRTRDFADETGSTDGVRNDNSAPRRWLSTRIHSSSSKVRKEVDSPFSTTS